ncbi:MAG: hypothetical protein ACXVIH_05330 [Ilumatobacteraceae bacterium]
MARTAQVSMWSAASPAKPKEFLDMKVKWKQQIARLIPALTAVAAVVLTIGAHADSVKWG